MKLEIERDKHGVHMSAIDSGRVVAHSSGSSTKEAARWLVHHVNRIADATEQLAIDMGLLSEEECEQIGEGAPVSIEIGKGVTVRKPDNADDVPPRG